MYATLTSACWITLAYGPTNAVAISRNTTPKSELTVGVVISTPYLHASEVYKWRFYIRYAYGSLIFWHAFRVWKFVERLHRRTL